MKCLACGAHQSQGDRFCSSCGAKLITEPPMIHCPECRAELTAESRFCNYCGARTHGLEAAANLLPISPGSTQRPEASTEILTGHTNSVSSLVFSPDGQLLASGSCDNTVRCWRLSDGKEVARFVGIQPFAGALAFLAPEGALMALTAFFSQLWLWRLSDHTLLHRGTYLKSTDGGQAGMEIVRDLAVTQDGRLGAAAVQNLFFLPSTGGGILRNSVTIATLPDLRERLIIHPSTVPANYNGPMVSDDINDHHHITTVALSSDYRVVALGTTSGKIELFERRQIKGFFGGARTEYAALGVIDGHADPVAVIALSSDGQMLATIGKDTRVCVWRVTDQKLLYDDDVHPHTAFSMSFSPNGRLLAAGLESHDVALWDFGSVNTTQQMLRGHSNNPLCLTFSSDSRILASGGADHTIRLWQV